MAFQNQGFWMPPSGVNDNERLYDNSSTTEPKRSHQWFMDGPDAQSSFPNKKQALEVPNTNLFSSLLNANASPWGNVPGFQSFSGQFTESEADRAMNFEDRDNPSVSSKKLRKVNEDLFGNDSLFGLSMSHSLEDPPNYGGFRKVKVSEVKDFENVMPSIGHAYNPGDNHAMLASHVYKMDDNSGSMGLTFKKEEETFVSMSDSCNRVDNNFRLMGEPFTKGDEYMTIGQTYKENDDTLLTSRTLNKGESSIISIGETYNKANESTMSTGHMYNKGEDLSMGHDYRKVDNGMLSTGHSYNKGESTIISFGGCDDDDDVNTTISEYELLMGQTFPKAEAMSEIDFAKVNGGAYLNQPHIMAGTGTVPRKKDDPKTSKKAPSNNFPSNVRSLLSTGMLDGVPVKYIAWSREKELQAVIKGSGYLCGCQSCNFSKVINAYEFERHASCKTKHPNNHIYFENGRTIYGIVQELRSTPQNMLFDVIQTITGSPINQKSFCLWKESFLAATRELQRIYGNHEVLIDSEYITVARARLSYEGQTIIIDKYNEPQYVTLFLIHCL